MRLKKIIASLLIAVLSVSVLVSCENDREYNETEVILAAESLIKKSEPLNEIYYGKGFLFTETGSGIYKKIDSLECERYGIHTIDALKERTFEVFSTDRAELMFSTHLSSIQDEDGNILHYARYYQHTSGDESYIMVNGIYEYSMTNRTVYDYSGISVYDVEGEIIIVSVPVTLIRTDGKEKRTELKIKLIEESKGWRICSASHAVYDENSDAYEDLLNQIK